ncbi:MAG: hypothetical protein NTW50_02390 [Candidatus Berkelbacteria bacterium]|nr:hypothetical protein [Candidatus Berkelbacteria bacterium]
MEEKLKKLIEIIKTGTRDKVKVAQKEIEKFWEKDYCGAKDRIPAKKAFEIFLGEIGRIDEIEDLDHQYYLINVLKWPFWAIGREHFEELSEFALKYIENPSGKIRQAINNATGYLVMDLNLHEFYNHDNKPAKNIEKEIALDLKRFGQFVDKVYGLVSKYHEPRFNRIKYVSSLPVGVYKSLQKLLSEHLLQSDYCESLYLDYLATKNDDGSVSNTGIIIPQIRLKYLKHDLNGKKLTYPDLTCSKCGKKDIPVGATLNAYSKNPTIICEDCAIDDYQKRYCFSSREAAAARRRRIFDIGYLLQEMIIDQYLKTNDIKDYGTLDIETIQFLGEISHQMYNENFSKTEKTDLENEPNQKIIEEKLKKKVRI